jgi:hypothetical protein
MTAPTLPSPCRSCGLCFSWLALGERFASLQSAHSATIPQIVRLLTQPMRYRQSIVRQIGAQIGRAGEINPSFRMIISLTEKNAAYRLAVARDIMAFQRNLETFLAKRPLGRRARDLAVFLGA